MKQLCLNISRAGLFALVLALGWSGPVHAAAASTENVSADIETGTLPEAPTETAALQNLRDGTFLAARSSGSGETLLIKPVLLSPFVPVDILLSNWHMVRRGKQMRLSLLPSGTKPFPTGCFSFELTPKMAACRQMTEAEDPIIVPLENGAVALISTKSNSSGDRVCLAGPISQDRLSELALTVVACNPGAAIPPRAQWVITSEQSSTGSTRATLAP